MEFGRRKLEWLEFDLFKDYPHVLHGVFQRHGGVSKKPYATLNIGDSVGDHPDSVKLNRDLIRKNFDLKHLVFPKQEHGTTITRITKENCLSQHHGDALFTSEPGIGLGVSHADCQGALFFDPIHQIVAVAHVGWRGNVQNLYAALVDRLKREVGTKPEDLLVAISPSLGPDHAEFNDYKKEFPQSFWPYQIKPHYFDLWEISKMQLTECGIREKHIEMAKICTVCSVEDYFSHRKEQKTGRNATVIALRGH